MTTTRRPSTDIHTWFSLSYCNYLVLHRTLLQSMPEEWQHRFAAIVEELHEAFRHIESPEGYEVQAVKYVERFVCSQFQEPQDCGEDCPDDCLTCREIAVPTKDPIPHYNRGRARLMPFGDALL